MSNQTWALYQCGSWPNQTTEKSWGWTKVEAEKRTRGFNLNCVSSYYANFFCKMKIYFWVRIKKKNMHNNLKHSVDLFQGFWYCTQSEINWKNQGLFYWWKIFEKGKLFTTQNTRQYSMDLHQHGRRCYVGYLRVVFWVLFYSWYLLMILRNL